MADRELTLYHAPNTRSTGTLILLEELGVPYRLEIVNLKTNAQHEPAYLAINPMGKVPAVKYGDAVVTEQVAVYLYLADLFPKAQLAPEIDRSAARARTCAGWRSTARASSPPSSIARRSASPHRGQ
jgi:glutathione S-transferase